MEVRKKFPDKRELPGCPLCLRLSAKRLYRKGPWQYFYCPRCPVVFLFPLPSADLLSREYQAYLPQEAKAVEQWHRMMKGVIEASVRLIEKKVPTGRILDVGSGYGFFLKTMAERGWQAEGIEISSFGREYCRSRFPAVLIRERPLPDSSIPDGCYDVVTLFYVLEHLPDPLSIIKEAGRILRPGGLLLIRWPHSTPIVRLLGPASRFFDLYHTPYHLFDYSTAFLEKVLLRLGFGSIETSIVGKSRPPDRWGRGASEIIGGLGILLSRWSNGRWLLPGVSKTTLALRI